MTAADVIDAHHHIWRQDMVPWLRGPMVPRIFGDYEPIRRDYSIAEYAADARPEGVRASVYVQVNVAPGEETAEIEWAAREGEGAGLIQAVTAFADLAAPDVGERLDRHQAVGTLRAIRQQLHWHPNPAYRFASRPDLMVLPQWRRGLRELERRGLAFELQVFPNQYPDALTLVRDFPGTRFILLHAGMPVERAPDAVAEWRRGLRAFAACDNVLVKLSGLGTFTRSCTQELWRPIIAATLELFGPRRCMYGSNFPIEKLWTTYAEQLGTFRACIADLSDAEQREVLWDVAARTYDIHI